MHAAQHSEATTCGPGTGRRLGGVLSWLSIAAVVLCAAGLGLRWIERTGTDLPPTAAMAQAFVGAAASRESVSLDVAAAGAGAEVWRGLWIASNGQYDARLLSTVALALQLAVLGLVAGIFARRLPPGGFFAWVLFAVAMLAARSAAGPRPLDATVAATWLVGGAVLQVALLAGERTGGWRLAAGLLCGAILLASGPEGLAPTITVLAWHALAIARDRTTWRSRRAVLAGSATLFVLGLSAVIGGAAEPAAEPSYLVALGATIAWPWRLPGWGLILWAPAVFCLVRVFGGDARRAALAPLALLGVALTCLAPALATPADGSGQAILLFGLAVNAACLVLWWCTSRRSAESRLVLASIWVLPVFLGLMHGGAPRTAPPVGPSVHDPATQEVRRAVAHGLDDNALPWSEPRIRAVLPPSIRLPLAWSPGDEPAWESRAPGIAGSDALPVVGTWTDGDPGAMGEWTSAWMQTPLPLLEVRISGHLRPPDTELLLRAEDGREIRPWTSTVSSPDRWRRVNLAAPAGRFRLIVRDASASAWIAVTAPVEIGYAGWAARKSLRFAPWLLAAGALCALGAAVCACTVASRAHATWVARGGPMFPWHFVPRLLLVGVAVYFAFNVDTTAGPNDSGGYLNSARLLASGRIATEPRWIFGPDGLDGDPRLHLPITFRVAPDGRLAPEYPVGMPLIIAAFMEVLPRDAAVAASILLHLIAGIVFTRALARAAGLPAGWAGLAAAMIGLGPLYLFQGSQPMSDVPALAWVTAAVCFAWHSRERPWLAVLSGLAAAMAVMIRPSNILCFLPIVVCLAGRWKQLAWWALAGLPGAAWLAWYQSELYGSAFATGYGDAGTMFGLKFLLPTLRSYALWLPELFTPLVALAIFGPLVRAAPVRLRLACALWAGAFLAFYSVYWCTWDTWYNMRFVLPAAPALVVLALVALRDGCRRLGLAPFTAASFSRGVVPTLVLLGLVAGTFMFSGASRRVLFWVHANREHAVAAQWARDHLPTDAVVFAKHASGSLAYYADLAVLRADRELARSPEFHEAVARTGRPVYAVAYLWEARSGDVPGGPYPDLPGRWERIASLWDEGVFVWRRAAADAGRSNPD